MDPHELTRSVGRRFHRPQTPSLLACTGLRTPIVFSHVAGDAPMPGRTLPPPVEDAYAFHVHHAELTRGDMWLEGRHLPLPAVRQGGVFIFDLRTEPVAQLHEAFEFSRFHLSRATVDQLAYEHGMKRIGELRATGGTVDPVVRHLALALKQRLLGSGDERDSLFRDAVALAFFSHVAQTYGGARPSPGAGPLAPWQLVRVRDWVDAHLAEPIAIADLAGLVDLSPSHFSRAFVASTGLPPHRWLLARRVERAKGLLRGSGLSLGEIAADCGFADQSHFTRVFSRLERATPARWRLARRPRAG